MTLTFKPIDLRAAAALCVRFREDSFVVSFGHAEDFHEPDGRGAERYLAWVEARQALDPSFCTHVWLDGAIVGQLEFGPGGDEAAIGYVNLYYLVPEHRGQGWAKHLDDHVCTQLASRGFTSARLSVAASNQRAIRFYERQGWRDLGPRPNRPEIHRMEKSLAPH
jgi:ribosomal protein S18 acetylase RimI-like enzyme